MEFILLMDRIKCWYNTPLQVLTNEPALHSLIICERNNAARILKFLFHIRDYLRKLIIKYCCLGEDSTGLLTNIVAMYLDLEILSLENCSPLECAGYCFIPRLKKLSELYISNCEVDYTGCGRKTWRFSSPVILATVWAGVMLPRSVASRFHAISVAMEQWTAQHHAFIVEAYFKNGDSAVTTQRLFRRHFNIPRHGRVPCRNTIKEWVQNFGKMLRP